MPKVVVPPFTPDVRLCLILGNYNYEKVRFTKVDEAGNYILDKDGNIKMFGFLDLPYVEADLELFK